MGKIPGFRRFSKIFAFLSFGRKLLQHWKGQVKKILKLLLSMQDIFICVRPYVHYRCVRVNFIKYCMHVLCKGYFQYCTDLLALVLLLLLGGMGSSVLYGHAV